MLSRRVVICPSKLRAAAATYNTAAKDDPRVYAIVLYNLDRFD